MKQFIAMLIVSSGLLFTSVASAVTVEIHDGFYDIFDPDPAVIYEVFPVVGGAEIFSFGFGFENPTDFFELTIYVPSTFIGTLFWARSSGIDGTGTSFGDGSLVADDSIVLNIGGVATSSSGNPHDEYLSLLALDMPPLSTLPTSAVPVPASLWLFGSGLMGLAGVARRKKK